MSDQARPPRSGPVAGLGLTLALASGGCSALASIDAGYQQPFSSDDAPGHRGVAVDIHYGGGMFDEPVGIEVALRTKQGSHQGQYAAALGAYAFTTPYYVGAFGRVGVNVIQAETWSGDFAFGMGSPWAEAGVYLLPEFHESRRDDYLGMALEFGGLFVAVKGIVGYDLRFTSSVPNTANWGAMVSVGFMSYAPSP